MGQPAARAGDMHACPMVTPGVPPIPHVGGPVLPPGAPTVLIGNMPAARATDMCTCVGPPDVIAKGSAGVMIMKLPAARMGDTTGHGGTIAVGFPTVLIGEAGGGGGGGGGGAGDAAMKAPPKKPSQMQQTAYPESAFDEARRLLTELSGSPYYPGDRYLRAMLAAGASVAVAVKQFMDYLGYFGGDVHAQASFDHDSGQEPLFAYLQGRPMMQPDGSMGSGVGSGSSAQSSGGEVVRWGEKRPETPYTDADFAAARARLTQVSGDPTWPKDDFIKMMLSHGATPEDCVKQFSEYLGMFGGSVYDQSVYDHDRGQEPATAWVFNRPMTAPNSEKGGP